MTQPPRAMLLAVIWLATVTDLHAQDALQQGPLITERYTAVRDRPHPETEPLGIVLGSFVLRPSLGVSGRYDDNVLATETSRRDDLAIRLSPQVLLQSNWGGSDRLSLRLAAQADRYARLTTENGVDLDAGTDGVVAISHDTIIRLSARWQYQRESRLSQDIFAQTEKPVRFSTAEGAVGASQTLGDIALSGDVSVQRLDYHDARAVDGTPVDEDFRDSDLLRLRGRISYSQSPSFGWFGQMTYDRRNYRHQAPGEVQRNSEGMQILGGATFEPAALLRGEIGVGYLVRRYNDPTFEDFSGFAVNGKLEFFFTQLTTLTVTAKREANDASIPQSTGYITTGGQASIDHELLRSLILSASVSYYTDKFNGINREDKRWGARAFADYQMNRNAALRLSFDHANLSSHGFDRYRSYRDNRLLLGVTLRQ